MNIGNICLGMITIFLSVPSLIIFGPFLDPIDPIYTNSDVSRITRDSSLSLNDTTPYWLSPSGNIAFGFYQLPWSPDQYTVGIWFPKSYHKTLVWTANHKELITDVHKPSSIFFTEEGKLIMRTDDKDKPLLSDVAEPVSYAKMHDNGNFVLYGSDSQIIWQSFDYPNDTLLGGQKLKLGVDHLISGSGKYKLSMRKTDGAIIIYNVYDEFHARVSSKPSDRPETMPATLNLNTAGILYLVNSDGTIHEIIYNGKKQHQQLKEGIIKQDYIYRATLDSEGDFVLYRERIDGNFGDNGDSTSSLIQLWTSNQWDKSPIYLVMFLTFALPLIFLLVKVNAADLEKKKKRIAKGCT